METRRGGWKRIVRSRRSGQPPDERYRQLLRDYRSMKAFVVYMAYGGAISIDRSNPKRRRMALYDKAMDEYAGAEVEFGKLCPQNGTIMTIRMK